MPPGFPSSSGARLKMDFKKRVSWHKRYRTALILYSVSLIFFAIAWHFMIIPLFIVAGPLALIALIALLSEALQLAQQSKFLKAPIRLGAFSFPRIKTGPNIVQPEEPSIVEINFKSGSLIVEYCLIVWAVFWQNKIKVLR